MQRLVQQRLADGAAGLGEVLDVLVGRDVAGLEMDLRHPAVVAVQEAQQHVGQIVAGGAVQPAHDPEIDRRYVAALVDEQVAGMKVGVEEAVAENLVEERR